MRRGGRRRRARGFAALTDASLVILARAARTVDARTYEQTVTRVVGPTGGFVVRICLCGLLFGTLVSLQIIAADLAAPVVEAAMYHDKTGGFWSTSVVAATRASVFALVYPLSLLENLGNSRSSVGVLLLRRSLRESPAFVRMRQLKRRWPTLPHCSSADVALVGTNPRAIALALPVGALAATCRFNVRGDRAPELVAIEKRLRRRLEYDAVPAVDATNAPDRDEQPGPERRAKKQTRRDDEAMIRVVVWLVAFPFYAAFATVGYLGFGRDVSGTCSRSGSATRWRWRRSPSPA